MSPTPPRVREIVSEFDTKFADNEIWLAELGEEINMGDSNLVGLRDWLTQQLVSYGEEQRKAAYDELSFYAQHTHQCASYAGEIEKCDCGLEKVLANTHIIDSLEPPEPAFDDSYEGKLWSTAVQKCFEAQFPEVAVQYLIKKILASTRIGEGTV